MLAATNRTLRVLFPRAAPYVYDNCKRFPTLGASPTCPYPGLCAEVLRAVANDIGVRIVPLLDNQPRENFDPGTNVPTVLMVKKVGGLLNDDGLWDFFDPFTTSMWLMAALLFILHCLLAILFAHGNAALARQRASSVQGVVWEVAVAQLRQQGKLQLKLTSSRLWFIVFAVGNCLLIPALYQTRLLAALLHSPKGSPFGSPLEAFAAIGEGRYRLIVHPTDHSWFTKSLNEPKFQAYKDELRGVRAERVENVLEALQCVSDGQCIMPTSMVSQPAQYRYRYNNIEFVPGDMPTGHSHFIFAKNSTLLGEFNRSLADQRPRLTNIMARYFKDLYRQKKATYRETSDNRAVISTRLYPYAGLLLSCGAAYILASVVFVSELLLTRYMIQKERSTQSTTPM